MKLFIREGLNMKKLLLIEIFLAIFTIVCTIFTDTVSTLRVTSILGWVSVIMFSIQSIKEL